MNLLMEGQKPSRGVHVVFNRVKAYQGNCKASAKSDNWPLTCSKVAARMLALRVLKTLTKNKPFDT